MKTLTFWIHFHCWNNKPTNNKNLNPNFESENQCVGVETGQGLFHFPLDGKGSLRV